VGWAGDSQPNKTRVYWFYVGLPKSGNPTYDVAMRKLIHIAFGVLKSG